jgi:hypothetical protein
MISAIDIVVAFFGSITIITCSSLWLVNVLDERQRKEDEKESRKQAVEIHPFEDVIIGTRCKLCNAKGDNEPIYTGPRPAQSCNAEKCAAFPTPHLDVYCLQCRGTYFMRTKSSK